METKLNLHLCGSYTNLKLKTAVTNCLLCDYAIEQLRLVLKEYDGRDVDFFHAYEEYKKIIVDASEITFSNIEKWSEHKELCYNNCLSLLEKIDDIIATAEKNQKGEVVREVKENIANFTQQLSQATIVQDEFNFGTIYLKPEYIKNLSAQLSIVDEGHFLAEMCKMKLQVIPLDTNKNRNKFIEKKLTKVQTVVASVEKALEKDFELLQNQISASHEKFYKIAHSAQSDGEKFDDARKVCRFVAPHRRVLDKLEDRLTKVNELKRQLAIHEKKLKDTLAETKTNYNAIIAETPSEKDRLDRDLDGLEFVTIEYLTNIKNTKKLVEDIENKITDRYKIIDRVDVAVKAAIPLESEMKRYSSLAFKFEDLYVRLDLAKSQIKDKNPDFLQGLKTAMAGLKVLIQLAQEGKDIFMRNSLLSAVFNCVNGVYDLVEESNKSVELKQIKFVTTRLVNYSFKNNVFVKDLQTFRHVCNNAIRDIAIFMGRPFSVGTMLEIVEAIELAIKQVQELVETVNKNHVEQSQLLSEILNI